ncbi:MAG: hypothetical protein RSC84_04395 [Peptostreptococcaceae bacterium]
MEIRKYKNKKCQRHLPEGYKYIFCEKCRNEQVELIKGAGKVVVGVAVFAGSTAITVLTKGIFNPKKE